MFSRFIAHSLQNVQIDSMNESEEEHVGENEREREREESEGKQHVN